MLEEVKKATKDLKTNKGIIQLRNQILLILLLFIILLAANRLFFIKYADQGEYYLAITRTKIAFAGNISVYTVDLPLDSDELAKLNIDSLDEIEPFYLPLFALVFYYPFTLISNFDWSFALWITTNQILVYFVINKFLKVINWKIKDKYRYIISLIFLLAYFIFDNVFLGNLSIIQTLLIVYALDKIKTKEYILSGILLGIASINPYQFFIPLIIIFILNMQAKRGIINLWAIITVILMSLMLVIFDMKWGLELLKLMAIKPAIFPFTSYGNYLSPAFPNTQTAFLGIIPIIVFIWLSIEWLRTPKENYFQELWIICLSFTLNAIIHLWVNQYSTIAYMLVFIYTISLWYERATKKFRYFTFGLYAVLFIILPIGKMITNQALLDTHSTYLYNILAAMALLLNLYWVRLWIANPYYSVNPIVDK